MATKTLQQNIDDGFAVRLGAGQRVQLWDKQDAYRVWDSTTLVYRDTDGPMPSEDNLRVLAAIIVVLVDIINAIPNAQIPAAARTALKAVLSQTFLS